jgi:hypothetical protein
MSNQIPNRKIRVIFVLGTGDFGTAGQNQVALDGLRTSVHIERAGGMGESTASVQIRGMTFSMMNQLSTLGLLPAEWRQNSISVYAGGSDSNLTLVFAGTITDAYPDFDNAPDVPFCVEAHTGLKESLEPVEPISYNGSVDISSLLSTLARKMKWAFENNGVSKIVKYPYYSGSPRDQAAQIVKDFGIEWNGGDNQTLAIWNPGTARGSVAAEVSPQTGLIGYPKFTSNGISFQTIFNPSIDMGCKVNVTSSIPGACGTWQVYNISHDLEALMPGGSWFSNVQASPLGYRAVGS